MTPSTINLADPDLYTFSDGLDVLSYLQREMPVYWNELPGGGFWALTRYFDAVSVYRRPRLFTSKHGIQAGQAGRADLPASGKMLVLSDEDTHRRIKAILGRHLTPSALTKLVPEIRQAAHTAVERYAGKGPFDFAAEAAGPIALTATGGLLGIPMKDRRLVSEWIAVAFGATTGEYGNPPSEMDSTAANAQLFVYFCELLAKRREESRGDLLSALTTSNYHGEQLSDEEILFNVHLLLAGGQETTRQVLIGAAVAFANHPEEWTRLRAESSLMAAGIEEIIRWTAPSLNVMRTATEDITIGGELIRVGEQITMWNPILNRDEAAFTHANSFNVGRNPNRHLSFGLGSHFCLGAWLARQELRSLIEALAPRVRHLELAERPRRTRSNRTWGYDYAPVRLIA
jgi:cytochrome P450